MSNANQADLSGDADLLPLTADIVSAYVSNNSIQHRDLADLIAGVHAALKGIASGSAGVAPAEVVPPTPAVPVKKSVTPEYIVCLEDGKQFKSLKRHLKSAYDMTPDQYRKRWNLPADYPMTAPGYSERRSALAKQMGLGSRAARGRSGRRAA